MWRPLLIGMWLLLGCGAAWPGDYETGLKSFEKGEYAAALDLLVPLARDGDPYSQYAIAAMYDDGVGKPQNFARALHWYRLAAEGGLVDAQYMVGRFHGGGRGVRQDPARALFWFNIAHAGGHPDGGRMQDQQRSQVSPARRQRVDDDAVAWHAKHPRQITCKEVRCLHPKWLQPPRWKILNW